MKNRILLRIISLCGLGLLYAAGVCAQDYPDIIWVPVTYYDFHSDRSNPEFEQRHMTADPYRTGMVARTLDAEGKPRLGPNPYMNYYIKYWFRPWESAAKGDFTGPHYSPRAGYKERYADEDWVKEYQEDITYLGVEQLDHDTSFKNIVIEDSLPFEHLGDGVYQYSNEDFFPLDDRGFGNEWNHELGNVNYNREQGIDPDHNYSFTMELHWQFVKKPGMTFDFEGDDDVFVFVNRELVLEIGGIHQPAQASFDVDDVGGLVNGRQYDLHVFYAERHSALSTIKITTNIISAPADMGLYPKGTQPDVGDNVAYDDYIEWRVGHPMEIHAHLFDSSKAWRPEMSEYVTWTVEGDPSIPSGETKSFLRFTPTSSENDLVITATYRDPNSPDSPPSIKTVRVKVLPGEPTQLDIQPDSVVTSYTKKDDFDGLYFKSSEDEARLWVVLRDEWGNYVRHATDAQWQSLNGEVAETIRLNGNSARVIKNFKAEEGEETIIIVREGNLKPDTIAVGSVGERSAGIGPNPFVPGKDLLSVTLRPETYSYYENVIKESGIESGTLVAVGTEKQLKANPKDPSSYGKVVIYDCVGNIVFQDEKGLKRAKSPRSYGFIWDGKNNRGRLVGPGVYLVRITGENSDNEPFLVQKKAGIKGE